MGDTNQNNPVMVTFPSTHRLTSTNYICWKTQIEAHLRGLDLYKFIDGTDHPSPNPPTQDYRNWFRQDQILFSALVGTLSPEIVPIITNAKTSLEAWNTLATTYAFDDKRDSPREVRSVILVVAALIASASFQAMANPPDVISNGSDFVKLSFICSITLAWSSSMNIIIMLIDSFRPFKREIFLFYVIMMSAFGLTAGVVAGNLCIGGISYILVMVCMFLPYASRWIPWHI